jgi:hypothetical protein
MSRTNAIEPKRLREPLQNRCDPFGRLHAVAARGGMMGNRGGRFHTSERGLGKRRFATKRWICCVCDFRGRRRSVWGEGYTELFFLDEVTALAAGHRPCFECRSAEAKDFAACFGGPDVRAPKADAMDLILHRERMAGWNGEKQKTPIEALPAGAMVAFRNKAYAVASDSILEWSFSGYAAASLPRDILAELLTPPSTVNALRNGYRPRWHSSAG